MNEVKKFSTFNELKSYESKTPKIPSNLKKHQAFKEIFLDIRSVKILQTVEAKSKS